MLGKARGNPAHKLCILSSIAFGIPLQFDAVYTEGISGISTDR